MNRPSWETNGFVLGQPVPSLDDKDMPSPPIVTTEEYHRDCENGFIRVGKQEDNRKT